MPAPLGTQKASCLEGPTACSITQHTLGNQENPGLALFGELVKTLAKILPFAVFHKA